MRPIAMFKYRGFLIRVCDNGASHRHKYEWTLDPITPHTRQLIKRYNAEMQAYVNQNRWCRVRKYQYFSEYRRTCFQKPLRVYDPTSMTSARGPYGALRWGKDRVDELLVIIKHQPRFNYR